MADDRNAQQVLLEELQQLLDPLAALAASQEDRELLLEALGWQEIALDESSLNALGTALGGIYGTIKALVENPPRSLEDLPPLLARLATAMDGIRRLASSGGNFPAEFQSFGIELLEYLVAQYLEQNHTALYQALVFFTLIRDPQDIPTAEWPAAVTWNHPVHGPQLARIPTPIPRLQLGRLGDLLSDPIGLLEREYFPNGLKPETVAASADKLFPRLGRVLESLGLATVYGVPERLRPGLDWGSVGNAVIPHMLTAFVPTKTFYTGPEEGPKIEVDFGSTFGLAADPAAGVHGMLVLPFGNLTVEIPVDDWKVGLELGGTPVAFAIGPRGLILLENGSPQIHAGLTVSKPPSVQGEPAYRFGSMTGTRLELSSLSLKADLGFSPQGTDGGFLIEIGKSALFIAPGNGDGFLQKVLPQDGLRIDFDLAFGWSKSQGVRFAGGAGLEVTLPVHLSLLGVVEVESISIALAIAQGGLTLGLGTTINARLGPVSVAIDRIGLQTELAFKDGNLGPVDLSLGFKPPSGLGIVIDAGPVTGGGFISFDHANGRYAGVLQLKLYSIGVTAIGLLDTKLPGGRPGFSFLIIIAVEFTPIQIGFGFTLNGVGGLAGINRTMVTKVLEDGLRSHALDSVLFPRDPVRRATQLISDLGRIFPPAEGRYVFGPMVKLGWGTFVEASLGVVLELPSPVRIAILGQLDAYFPVKVGAIVELHLDVLGLIDFGAKFFSLDACLHDSRVLLFSISGDMAMRLFWGDNPSFALALGGFNPHFQPPPSFPVMRRLTIALGYGDNPRLSLEAYFALTSNSFQFGAALSLYAALGSLSVRGYLGFDALFIFSPFSFRIDFAAGFELRLGSLKLAGIHLQGTLMGPTPWHVIGEASISILFFEISVHVEFTVGEERREELPAADPWPLLQAAVEKRESWSAVRPPMAFEAVKLKAPDDLSPAVLIDPVGGATLRQKVVPLNQPLSKFGETRPLGPDSYKLDPVQIGTPTPPATSLVYDHFAPGQFREMDDAEKISGPSFVEMPSGFTLASDAADAGRRLASEIRYATTVLTAPGVPPASAADVGIEGDRLLALARRGAAGVGFRATGLEKYAPEPGRPPQVAMAEDRFAVYRRKDLRRRDDVAPPGSKGMVQNALAHYLASHPAERGELLVIAVADVEEVAA